MKVMIPKLQVSKPSSLYTSHKSVPFQLNQIGLTKHHHKLEFIYGIDEAKHTTNQERQQ